MPIKSNCVATYASVGTNAFSVSFYRHDDIFFFEIIEREKRKKWFVCVIHYFIQKAKMCWRLAAIVPTLIFIKKKMANEQDAFFLNQRIKYKINYIKEVHLHLA